MYTLYWRAVPSDAGDTPCPAAPVCDTADTADTADAADTAMQRYSIQRASFTPPLSASELSSCCTHKRRETARESSATVWSISSLICWVSSGFRPGFRPPSEYQHGASMRTYRGRGQASRPSMHASRDGSPSCVGDWCKFGLEARHLSSLARGLEKHHHQDHSKHHSHWKASAFGVGTLAFDIGLNNGDDTALLLMHGYRVIAVEADPRYIRHATARFASALADGRLSLANVALPMKKTGKQLSFFVNQHYGEWSSFDARTGCRVKQWATTRESAQHPDNCVAIPINTTRCRDLFHTYGVPKILKVDVEGAETTCINDLRHFRRRPAYIIQEALHPNSVHWNRSTSILDSLGYSSFKWVNQHEFMGVWGRSSGPLGEFSLDCERRWRWRTLGSLRRLVLRLQSRKAATASGLTSMAEASSTQEDGGARGVASLKSPSILQMFAASLNMPVQHSAEPDASKSRNSTLARCDVWADLHARHQSMERAYGQWGQEYGSQNMRAT